MEEVQDWKACTHSCKNREDCGDQIHDFWVMCLSLSREVLLVIQVCSNIGTNTNMYRIKIISKLIISRFSLKLGHINYML